MKKLAFAAAFLFAVSAPLHAQILLSDNFNSEGPAGSSLNFNLFTNWNVTGSVDLVNSGDYGITCAGGSGKCVDMDGSPGPGKLTTKSFYSFVTGDKMRIAFDVSGNQRTSSTDDMSLTLGFSSATGGSSVFAAGGFAAVNGSSFVPTLTQSYSTNVVGTAPFSTWIYEFTALNAGSVNYALSTSTTGSIGPMLDNVVISRTAANTSTVPEPSTYAMMAAGLVAMVVVSRRRRA
jgi:hypothetical protein